MTGLSEPVRLALVGTGNRATKIYAPLFSSLGPWVRLVAVCDPVREHADAMAEALGVRAFYSLPEMVRAKPMEAALVVTPIPSHHAISCYLSQHGLHNLVETSMAALLMQARDMVSTARENQVIFRVAENFFRFPFDRMMQKIDQTGFIGEVKRLTCFQDHTGFHNNSRWIRFFGSYPQTVQGFSHQMPVVPYHESAHRFHTDEFFRCRLFIFPRNRLVVDMTGNMKSALGRYPRPGYTELDGARGAIVQTAQSHQVAHAEVRYCSDESLEHGGRADEIYPIVHINENGSWIKSFVDLPVGHVEWVNPFRPIERAENPRDYYGAAVMGHIADFACTIRGQAPSEYSDEDALMSMMMDVAARESALHGSLPVALPLKGDVAADEERRKAMKEQYGVDPMDVEGMLAISYPRP